MNVGQIKAFMGDQKVEQKAEQKATVHPNEVLKKQLQQESEGLANVGIGDCANEPYTISFIVLS